MAGSGKVYTKGGDKGQTSLIGGTRVSKGELRLDCYGTIDELNSIVGLLRVEIASDIKAEQVQYRLQTELQSVQNELFDAGSHLACEDENIRIALPAVGREEIERLEKSMDEFSKVLKPLKNFVLPGGSRSSSLAHVARTVCRRAERLCVRLSEIAGGTEHHDVVKYVNRLSDYFFVLARYLNECLSIDEPIWSAKTAHEKTT